MRVKLIKDYEGNKAGEIIEVADAKVSTLKIQGIAVKALDEKAEKASAEQKVKLEAKVQRIQSNEANKKAAKKTPVKKTGKK